MSNNYVDINVNVKGKTHHIQLEKGCTFETKLKRIQVDNNGKLSIFNKETGKKLKADNLSMTNYQFSAFKAMANNVDEGTGKYTLSIADIKDAMKKFKNKNFTKDIQEFLTGNYKATQSKLYSNENKITSYITNGNKNTSGTMVFQFNESPSKTPEQNTSPTSEKYVDIKVKVKDKIHTIQMEKGCTFETKLKRFHVDNDGKLTITKKDNGKKVKTDNLSMTNYQFSAFKAMANNTDEKTGKITLSKADIDEGIGKYRNKEFTKDMQEFLVGGYTATQSKLYSKENKITSYITNGKESTSGTVVFKYDDTGVNPTEPVTPTTPTTPETPPQTTPSDTNNIFTNPNIITQKAFTYTVKSGDDLVKLAREYEIDTYQIIAANPQLKAGKDYKVTYSKSAEANMTSYLKVGQKITIPARYKVKSGSCKNIDDVAKITGYPKSYIEEILLPCEVGSSKIQQKYLTTYRDNHGLATIGFGHIGRVNGKPLSLKNKIHITEAQAYEILAEDILKHEAMNIAYFGKNTWQKTPKSVRMAILDNTYNKGIWAGYLSPTEHCKTQKQIKDNLQKGHYASALKNTARYKTDNGIRKRSVYRFIAGLADLPADKRKAAIKAFTPYYQETIKKLKGANKTNLINAWNNAVNNNKYSGFRI